MSLLTPRNNIYKGIGLATLACLVWSGNFIVARGVYKQIQPVSLAFLRWSAATIFILPFAWKKLRAEKNVLAGNYKYLFLTALTGIGLYNTLIYTAAHYSPATNIALIGTTSSPVFSIILARIFLKEKITLLRITGLLICIGGILLLMSGGHWHVILSFQFSAGDKWILAAALFFAIYNLLARKKPAAISPAVFLFAIFAGGTLLLLPFFIRAQMLSPAAALNWNIWPVILYLGLGASVVSYLCWNAAIQRLGVARTSLFGNLIPVFSGIEAAYILQEPISFIFVISLLIVIIGLVIANLQSIK